MTRFREVVPTPVTTDDRHRPSLQQARALIDTPQDVGGPSRLPTVARFVRRTINRALADHDRQVTIRLNALADAVAEQNDRLDGQMPPQEVWDRFGRLGDHVERLYELVTPLVEVGATREVVITELRAKFAGLRRDLLELRQELQQVAQLSQQLDRHAQYQASDRETLTAVQESVVDLHGFVEKAVADIDEHLGSVDSRTNSIETTATRLTQEMIARPYLSEPDALTVTEPGGHVLMGFTAESAPHGSSYADFEDLFRGSQEMIAGRLKPYLSLLAQHAPVLDIGCGRGELLELLRADGVDARGVDPDASMVDRCRAQGLDVEAIDGQEALRRVDAGSLGAVVSFQVVEHVELSTLRELFQASYDALRPGGILVAETVNPHSPMALKAFWLDLTHIRPLYPEALLLLAREMGFQSAYIMFPQGTGDLDEDLRTCGEYALVATK